PDSVPKQFDTVALYVERREVVEPLGGVARRQEFLRNVAAERGKKLVVDELRRVPRMARQHTLQVGTDIHHHVVVKRRAINDDRPAQCDSRSFRMPSTSSSREIGNVLRRASAMISSLLR